MNENDWVVRIESDEYRAPDLPTLQRWVETGKIPMSAFIRNPTTTAWCPIADVPELAGSIARLRSSPLLRQSSGQVAPAKPASVSWCGGGCLIALGVVGVFFVFLMIVGSLASNSKSSSTPTPNTTPPATSGPSRLYVSGLDQIVVCKTEEAFERFLRASARKDKYGHAELALSGQCVLVRNGTRVQVLDYGFAKHQVRILEGSETGTSGWVPREWVQNP